MEAKGKLSGITRNWATGKMQLTFEVEQDVPVEGMQDKILRITAKQWKEKRSLDANAYYWVLISKLAGALKISNPRTHNLILRKYGQNDIIDGQLVWVVIPDTEKAENMALEAETFHIRPTSQTIEDKGGNKLRTYVYIRGSHTYDTAEMSHLIDGLVAECKELGIETLPPDEISRMMEEYEKHRRQHG